jgi:hypothetical protein
MEELLKIDSKTAIYVKRLFGSDEISSDKVRYCLWISDEQSLDAAKVKGVENRLKAVSKSRLKSTKLATKVFSDQPHRFTEIRREEARFIAVPCVSSENRQYITPVLFDESSIISNRCFGIYDVPNWYLALLTSKLHQLWVEVSSGKLETRLNYSNTLSWNTFPVPPLTEQNKTDLTRCAENILLAREAHYPATIADLYDPETMDEKYPDLRRAHDANDEVLERIYIGRRFKNDTERLEKLFELYTKMTTGKAAA